MRLVGVSYEFPLDQYHQILPVCARMTLVPVVKTDVSFRHEFQVDYYGTDMVGATADRINVLTGGTLPQPDFVILSYTFRKSQSLHWKALQRFQLFFADEGRSFGGVIRSVDPKREWNSVSVEWDTGGPVQFVSHWELEPEKDDDGESESKNEAPNSIPDTMTEAARNFLSNRLQLASLWPESSAFLNEVDAEEYPTYRQVVPLPLSLNGIAARLSSKYYRSVSVRRFPTRFFELG